MNLRREYADEITMCSLVTSSKDKMALFCYSFLVSAFQDVVCLRINDLPADFHKVYLTSRRETHPKVVDDFIEFMSAYRFPTSCLKNRRAVRLAFGLGALGGTCCVEEPKLCGCRCRFAFSPRRLAAAGGAFVAVNGLYGGHCVWFEGRRWAICPKMTDIRWKSASISG